MKVLNSIIQWFRESWEAFREAAEFTDQWLNGE